MRNGSPLDLPVDSPAEVARLLESFRPFLVAIAEAEMSSRLGGKLGASDVVQDTIIKGLERISQFQGTTREEFAGWLRAILHRRMADVADAYHTRKRNVSREQPGGEAVIDVWQSSPSGCAASREEYELLDGALAFLSDESRRVIVLRHRDNRTFAEIGAAIGKSEEAARKIWVRALASLQRALAQSGR